MSESLLRIDFGNVFDSKVGAHGLPEKAMKDIAPRAAKAAAAVQAERGTGWLRWMELPYRAEVVERILASVGSRLGRFDDLVVLGIGGSALGNTAVQTALRHPSWNSLSPRERAGRPRLHVVDNDDPVRLAALFDVIDPARTLFNVITKSGSTAETISQFMCVKGLLDARLGGHAAGNIVCTTDEKKGPLREIVNAEGYESFTVPDGVGGRFSVLSEVGLYSAAMTGVDIRAMLAGAARADAATKKALLEENPAAMLAAVLHLLDTGLGAHIHVMMPYSHQLRDVADWYRQLWAESLGKARDLSGKTVNVGPTPVKALGVTDQHSQIQLYTEGPFDKVVMLVSVDELERDLAIPKVYADKPDLGYLGGRTFGELMNAEMRATEVALTAAGRPNLRIAMSRITPESLGAFFYLFEVTTAIAGRLYGVDAFDQPGVEAGKIATYALMGRKGYEKRRREIESAGGSPERLVMRV